MKNPADDIMSHFLCVCVSCALTILMKFILRTATTGIVERRHWQPPKTTISNEIPQLMAPPHRLRFGVMNNSSRMGTSEQSPHHSPPLRYETAKCTRASSSRSLVERRRIFTTQPQEIWQTFGRVSHALSTLPHPMPANNNNKMHIKIAATCAARLLPVNPSIYLHTRMKTRFSFLIKCKIYTFGLCAIRDGRCRIFAGCWFDEFFGRLFAA